MSNALHWQVKIVMSTKQPTAAPAMPTTVAVPTGPVAVGKRPAELQSPPAPHLPLTRARSWHATAKHACGSCNQPMVWYRQSQQPDSHVEPCPKLQAAAPRRQRPTSNRRDRFQPSRHFARYLAIHHWRIASQHLSLHVTSPTGSSVRSTRQGISTEQPWLTSTPLARCLLAASSRQQCRTSLHATS